MLKTEFDGRILKLSVDGFELLSTPFISAIKLEKTITSRRGTVMESIVELEHARLNDVERVSGNTFVMSGDGHSLRMEVTECELGCELFFEGEEGWSYEFRIPAMARSVTSSPSFALTDIRIWSAEPGLSEIGFGEKSAYKPFCAAIVRTTEIKVLVLSAAGSA